jgi:hypothetical protein
MVGGVEAVVVSAVFLTTRDMFNAVVAGWVVR